MSVRKKLHIGMSLAPTWFNGEGWRKPESHVEDLFTSDFALDIARRAEAAKLDFVFRPDALYLPVEALETGPTFTSLDPSLLLAALARETRHIGLVTTVSALFVPPFVIARQLQSLNWLSHGRAGWNIVTAFQGHENFGLEAMPTSQDRYAQATECVETVRRLWQSFPAEALKVDREAGRYADTSRIRPLEGAGARGPLNLPAHPARIPLMQAGASENGRDFAAATADLVFAATPDCDAALELRHDLRSRTQARGRNPDDLKVLPALNLYLADSYAEARDLFNETHARVDVARKLAVIRTQIGLDLTDWPRTRAVTVNDLPPPLENVPSLTHAHLLRRLIEREAPTLEDLLRRPEVLTASHWQVVGTVDTAFAEVRDWFQAGAIDGFVIAPGGSIQSAHLALEGLVPQLANAGLFRTDYSGATFADHLR